MSKSVISILLPTRGRTAVLKKSIGSLLETASDPTRIELLLGIDDDDHQTKSFITNELSPFIKPYGIECRAHVFKPMGYENLHTYVNTLASAASGQWLFFWNDDGVMLSNNWDTAIDQYTGQFKLLAPVDNHDGHPYAIFPIVPIDWFRLMDHLSLNAQNDAWLSHIAYMLDIFERVPEIEFLHDRADLTGNNNDDTFRNRVYMEGNPADPRDFGHPDMQQARVKTAFKIAWFLEKIGQKSEWWNNVVAGTQDPYAKMITSSSVKGAGIKPAKSKAVSDDEKLIL